MNYYVDASIMKRIDDDTIHNVGIPSLVLMERAALKVVSNIKRRENIDSSVLVVCGIGNNGGDGVCIARILHNEGWNVCIYMLGDVDRCSRETSLQMEIAKNCGVSFVNQIESESYDIIIDGIFGIGLSRDIEGIHYDVIQGINNAHKKVYAIDIPSGINTDNGRIHNIAIKADYTITFGVSKKGLILHPGRLYAGKVIVEDIGFTKHIIDNIIGNNIDNVYEAFSKNNYKEYLPARKKNSNKGNYGKVLVVAGSKNMAGACYFSAKSAYRVGVGLVRVFTCEDNRSIIQELVPEAILTTYSTEENIYDICSRLKEALAWCDVVIVGPGLGMSDLACDIVECVINSSDKVKVIDADAINIIAKRKLYNINNAIFTPHMKEMSRLLDCSVSDIQHIQHNPIYIYNRMKDIYFDKNMNNVLVLKDATTLITDGKVIYVNTSGNNGLATAGSGDVLAGIIAGLLAQGTDMNISSSLGVYIHGLSAEDYTERFNAYSLNASDLIDSLQYIL